VIGATGIQSGAISSRIDAVLNSAVYRDSRNQIPVDCMVGSAVNVAVSD
jgi:hypothetical protein